LQLLPILLAVPYIHLQIEVLRRPVEFAQDVFVYFNNDGDANAVRNARTLRALLNQ
jgi:uncharacterized protein YecE (DUF72 family)